MNTISNYCRFIGRLVQDPKTVKFENTELCTFTLAVTEYRREKMATKKRMSIFLTLKHGTLAVQLFKNTVVKAT